MVLERFALQAASRSLLPAERVAGCLRTPTRGTVEVLHVPARPTGVFRGLQTCASVWSDPVCAAKISERRRVELDGVMAAWESQGGRVLVATYTIRHHLGDKLAEVLGGLMTARILHRRGHWAERARSLIAASVRAMEITNGANGWHPHLHDALFVAPGVGVNEAELAQDLGDRWTTAVEESSLRAGINLNVNDHGFDLSSDPARVAEYLTKVGHDGTWTLAHELTKQVVKRGRAGARSAVDLLAAYLNGDDDAGALFREYALTMKGRRQLVWSRGARKLLGLDAEKSDEELAAEVSEDAQLMAMLNLDEWRVILGNDLRGELLQVAGRGDRKEVEQWLSRLPA